MATKTRSISGGERTRRAAQHERDTPATGSAGASASSAFSQEEQEQAQARFAAVNLDEWIATPLRVAFTEWEEVEEPLWEGSDRTVKRLIPHKRYAALSTFIPSEVELAALDIIQSAVQQDGDDGGMGGEDAGTGTPGETRAAARQITNARQAVLLAWRCFEPDMTLERLARGLTLEQTMALMQRFFMGMSRQPSASPSSDAPTPNGSIPSMPQAG